MCLDQDCENITRRRLISPKQVVKLSHLRETLFALTVLRSQLFRSAMKVLGPLLRKNYREKIDFSETSRETV